MPTSARHGCWCRLISRSACSKRCIMQRRWRKNPARWLMCCTSYNPALARDEAAMPHPDLLRTMSEGAHRELKKLVGILGESKAKATVSVRVREGRAHEVILREAASTNATLIIMGTRNRSWLSGLLRRNTVKRVLQDSPCPVMVLRTGLAGRKDSRPNPDTHPKILMLNLARGSLR